MKRIKKLAALMMAAIMVLAMSMTVLADEDEQEPVIAETTYQIYQIFTGDYHEGVLSNVRWGQNGTGYDKAIDSTKPQPLVDKETLDELEKARGENDTAIGDTTDVEQLKIIEKYVDLKSTPMEEGESDEYELPSGYYLVSGTVTYKNVNPDNPNETTSVKTLYVVQVTDGTLKITPKVDVPKVTKKIVEGENKVDQNEASIGDDVHYEIVGTMPSNIETYETYTYIFEDTMSAGLTFKGFDDESCKVTVNGVEVKDLFYKSSDIKDDKTTIIVGIQDLKSLEESVGKITDKTTVVFTYSARLNEDAVIAGDGNKNDVLLKYSNDPNKHGTGKPTGPNDKPEDPDGVTPKDEVVTYTTELAILKVDEAGEILQGAEFTIEGQGVKVSVVSEERFVKDENGAYWKLKNGSYTTIAPVTEGDKNNSAAYESTTTKYNLIRTITTAEESTKAVATIDDDGRVTFTGLGAGTYTIKETVTPDGYNTAEDITFTVTFDPEEKEFSADKVNIGANNTLETTIINRRGSVLPSTGGIGTTIFYVVGAILVIGAGVILVAKKRMSREV